MATFIGRLTAVLVPDSSPKVLRGHGLVYCAWGCFVIFGPGPEGTPMVAGIDLKVAAAAVIGLLLVRTLSGPRGPR